MDIYACLGRGVHRWIPPIQGRWLSWIPTLHPGFPRMDAFPVALHEGWESGWNSRASTNEIFLQKINISPGGYRHIWVDDFPNFPRWDMLISWRVILVYHCYKYLRAGGRPEEYPSKWPEILASSLILQKWVAFTGPCLYSWCFPRLGDSHALLVANPPFLLPRVYPLHTQVSHWL